jgi:putative SOS response-associated peptidase YedK
MCGRFVLDSELDVIVSDFEIEHVDYDPGKRYNIAPTQDVAIVMKNGGNGLRGCRWGFVPGWARDLSIGSRMINARSETVSEKPSFKNAFKKQRCLIVTDGFYEWRKTGRTKTPFYIRMKSGRPFGFAGLYGTWTSPGKKPLCTCTIITTTANRLLEPIHDRMPVIIPRDGQSTWLDPEVSDVEMLRPLLGPYRDEELEAYEVSTLVNSVTHDSPENIRPVK